jgi:rod shape-determining protein MreD
MQSFRKRIEQASGMALPAAIIILMLLLSAVLSHIAGLGQVMPLLTLINIYYWSVFYPGMLPYWLLFTLGILQDTLTGQPLGFSSFINIIFAWMLTGRLHMLIPPSFAMLWLRFALSACAMVLLEWVVMGIYYGRILPFNMPALQWLSSCLAYPPVHFFLASVYRRMDSGNK